MRFKKFTLIWALLVLILGQAALVEHNVAHMDHGFSQETATFHGHHDEHQHDNDENNEKHECPECLLTQSLQTAFYNAPVALSLVTKTEILTPQQQYFTIAINRYKANSPRAPPVNLI